MEFNWIQILEVSQKQSYIFNSNLLRENAEHSRLIDWVISSEFFQRVISDDYYTPEQNLVYTGGGHTILHFATKARADAFASRVTKAVLTTWPGLELFVKSLEVNTGSPGETVTELVRRLEQKKSLRKSAFRTLSYGVERLDPNTFQKCLVSTGVSDQYDPTAQEELYRNDYLLAKEFEDLTLQNDNFLAVVCIDSNGMGKRSQAFYYQCRQDWAGFCADAQCFSNGIDQDHKKALDEVIDHIIQQMKHGALVHWDFNTSEDRNHPILPIRKVICAGDDVCFVTTGKLGLEAAAAFLRCLSRKENKADGQHYSACAGVAIVHKKFPFHRAYQLAEQLCSNAKKYGTTLSPDGKVSAIDWHIEFGQMRETLSEIKQEYYTGDGKQLQLRPLTVVGKSEKPTYAQFRALVQYLQTRNADADTNTVRSKLKGFRTELKKGAACAQHYVTLNQMRDSIRQMHQHLRLSGLCDELYQFFGSDSTARCTCFDAIEIIDHFIAFQEGVV